MEMNPTDLPDLSKPKCSGSNRRKTSKLEISISIKIRKICLDRIFSSPAGCARIPGSEPIHLDLEKLFLLSVSKENLDFRPKIEKSLPYKILFFLFVCVPIIPFVPFFLFCFLSISS